MPRSRLLLTLLLCAACLLPAAPPAAAATAGCRTEHECDQRAKAAHARATLARADGGVPPTAIGSVALALLIGLTVAGIVRRDTGDGR